MTKNDGRSSEVQTESATVKLVVDIREVLEQLGIDLTNWPEDLPPISTIRK